MKRRHVRAGIACLGLLFVAVGYTNCAGSSPVVFQEDLASQSEDLGADTFQVAKSVSAQQVTKLPLDIIWVIDNSGSMGGEAAHVRNNFNAFISRVSRQADVHVGLISAAGTSGTAVSMASVGNSRIQVNQTISSSNGPSVLASNLTSKFASVGFFRQNSKKVFVFVTDADSSMKQADFLNAVVPVLGSKPVVYSFIDLQNDSNRCGGAGRVYEALASLTGGSLYDICATDWSSHFDDLTQSVSNLAVSAVAFQHSQQKIEVVEVTLDGTHLSQDQYQITAQGIVLNSDLFTAHPTRQLRFVYKVVR